MSRFIATLTAAQRNLITKGCAANDAVFAATQTRKEICVALAATLTGRTWHDQYVAVCEAVAVGHGLTARSEKNPDGEYWVTSAGTITINKRASAEADAAYFFLETLRTCLKAAGKTPAGSRNRGKVQSANEIDVLARDVKLLARHLKAGEYTRKQLLAAVSRIIKSA